MTDRVEDWLRHQPADVRSGLGVLWGKSGRFGGDPNLLVQHLMDALAVAEVLWDEFLAPNVRDELDRVTDGSGRRFFAWLCGIHDVGKASPAFQGQDDALGAQVRAIGLEWRHPLPRGSASKWRHERASAAILRTTASGCGWSSGSIDWVWPIIAGHHGRIPPAADVNNPQLSLHGRGSRWATLQRALIDLATTAAGYDGLGAAEPSARPTRGTQLALSGLVIMADWIASNSDDFSGTMDLETVRGDRARRRATEAVARLGLSGGWGRLTGAAEDPIAAHFGVTARPSQSIVVAAAQAMPCPGLLIVEAPTGDGKTEAALAAAEVFAARFGADGVFVGLPTQATSDPMLPRVGAWANQIHPGVQVALLHGKRRFNTEWAAMEARRRGGQGSSGDEFGTDARDDYGARSAQASIDEGGESAADQIRAAVEWLMGAKRGLLAPVAIGTIDQLLFAATRTKHVAVRFAGLAGKVVIVDEVHAADMYMQQFLAEALWWLGRARVPVILLSATLPPTQRELLASSYLFGASDGQDPVAADLADPEGYPSVTSVWWDDGPVHRIDTASPWRRSVTVTVEILDEPDDDAVTGVADLVEQAIGDGGCVLVLRNTVARAQDTYQALAHRLGGDVVLLHGRLSAGDRAARTEDLIARLGPPREGAAPRPDRLVVVATQVAEQSFDVDADLLVTDLAPVDLLIQRAGRLHRHDRPKSARPASLRTPRIVVTGLRRQADAPPCIIPASLAIYGEHTRARSRSGGDEATPYRGAAPLLCTAALVEAAAATAGWVLPTDVPSLVRAAYGKGRVGPPSWHAAEEIETDAHDALVDRRAKSANPFLLAARDNQPLPTLEGLHTQDTRSAGEDELRAVVRDGPESAEVLLLRRRGDRVTTLDDTDLGLVGERIRDDGVAEATLAGTVRLPAHERLVAAIDRVEPEHRRTVSALADHPWLAYVRLLVLDETGSTELGDGQVLRYDPELGLLLTPAGAGTT